jgi:histone H3/H4
MNKKVGSKVNALKTRIDGILPSSKALKEMRYYQKTTESLIPKLSFERLVRRITPSIGNDFDYQLTTLDALGKSYEKFVVRLLVNLKTKTKNLNSEHIIPFLFYEKTSNYFALTRNALLLCLKIWLSRENYSNIKECLKLV